MHDKKTMISLAVSSAFAATLCAVPIASAAESPFAAQSIDKGYMLAYADKVDANKYGGAKSGEGKCGMAMADANKDGKISQKEYMKLHAMMFTMMDTNKDGFIDKDEMSKAMSMMKGMKGAKGMEGKCGAMKGMEGKKDDMK